ncbi:MAG: hypothetical protein KF764_35175 [Labilithrix sp.]|nr:hypothetical protein [Labilithrix sp.]
MPDDPNNPREDPPLEEPAETPAETDREQAEAGRAADDSEENERPTVSPPFDPVAFARDILKPSPAPMPATRAPGDLHTHATPPQGTEQLAAAAKASRPSGRTPTPRRRTPTSTLSLANARIPSNLPPRPGASKSGAPKSGAPKDDGPKKHESLSAMNPVDREWADLEIATRPPPADGPGEDPVIEIAHDRPPQLELDEVDIEEHGAATVRRPVPEELVKPREREMNDRVELGDYSGALEIAEKILADKPDDLGARTTAETCRTVLRQMYAARIGPLDRVPVVMVPRDQLRWLSIDHKAGFVLSLVDGVSSLEMIIDVSGMPELDTLRILSELAQQRIISLR